jgi:hypothetical protein
MPHDQVDQEWYRMRRHLPAGWEQAAYDKKAIKIARGNLSNPERLLWLLLGRAASNGWLRAVAGYARQAGLADVSNVAVLKRERSCGDWLEWIADQLLARTAAELAGSGKNGFGAARARAGDIRVSGPSRMPSPSTCSPPPRGIR